MRLKTQAGVENFIPAAAAEIFPAETAPCNRHAQ